MRAIIIIAIAFLFLVQFSFALPNNLFTLGKELNITETNGKAWTNVAVSFRGINLSGARQDMKDILLYNESCSLPAKSQIPLSINGSLDGFNSKDLYNITFLLNLSASQTRSVCLEWKNNTASLIEQPRVRILWDIFNESGITGAQFENRTFSGSTFAVSGGEAILVSSATTSWISDTEDHVRIISLMNFTKEFTYSCEFKYSLAAIVLGNAMGCIATTIDAPASNNATGSMLYKDNVGGGNRIRAQPSWGATSGDLLNPPSESTYYNTSLILNYTENININYSLSTVGSIVSNLNPGFSRNKVGAIAASAQVGDVTTMNIKWVCAVDSNYTCVANDNTPFNLLQSGFFMGTNFTVIINNPINTTYIAFNISLNYVISNSTNETTIDKIFYSLNNGANVTINGNTTFFGVIGTNSITLYANDTTGSIYSDSETFTVAYYKFIREDYTVNVLQGQTTSYSALFMYISPNITTILGNLSLNGTIYHGSTNILNSTHINITTTLSIPNLPSRVITSQLPHIWNLSIVFLNGSSSLDSTTEQNQTVTSFQILSCGGISNATTLNFSLYDEKSLQSATSDFAASFDLKFSPSSMSSQFSFNGTNSTYYSFCIFPVTATLYVDAFIQYNGTGSDNVTAYPIRHYILQNAPLSNISNNISLYMIRNYSASLVPITVKSSTGITESHVIVKVQKFYAAENLFRLVAMEYTNDQGVANIYLEVPSYYYKVIIEDNGEVLANTTSQAFTSTGITVTTSISLPIFFGFVYGVSATCNANQTSRVISCLYSDATGLTAVYNLTVTKRMPLSNVVICSREVSSSSSTLICDLSVQTNGTYPYTFTLNYGQIYPLYGGELTIGGGALYGQSGYFIAMIIFLTIALFGVFKPEAVMLFGIAGLVIVSLLNLIVISLSIISALGIIIIIYIVRKRP